MPKRVPSPVGRGHWTGRTKLLKSGWTWSPGLIRINTKAGTGGKGWQRKVTVLNARLDMVTGKPANPPTPEHAENYLPLPPGKEGKLHPAVGLSYTL